MKFCQPHWKRLREAIKGRGLDHLVAQSGQEAVDRMKAELEGSATDATFCPLLAAHNMIVAEALEVGGLYLLTGEYCPVCEAVKHKPDDETPEGMERHWIEGPADAVLQTCKEKGLIPTP